MILLAQFFQHIQRQHCFNIRIWEVHCNIFLSKNYQLLKKIENSEITFTVNKTFQTSPFGFEAYMLFENILTHIQGSNDIYKTV